MKKLPKIRPPRTPRGEDPKVTIANQMRLINNLSLRISELVIERDQLRDRAVRLTELPQELNDALSKIKHLEEVATRMKGWQDCAREILGGFGK